MEKSLRQKVPVHLLGNIYEFRPVYLRFETMGES